MARNEYHNVRKLYNKYKTQYYKKLLRTVSKNYKNTISNNIKRFKDERINKLKTIKSSHQREFWKVINGTDRNKDCKASLQDLFSYFEEVNSGSNIDETSQDNDILDEIDTEAFRNINKSINNKITESEILTAVKNLKNNKSPGIDNILNEHLKNSILIMMPVYVKLFNIVFNYGIVPDSWSIGDILPIYKNKGSASLPENYRPITLLSCLGKLFTSIINNRLNKFAEHYNVINPSQAGFRKGFSTVDNIFIIQSLIEISKISKNKLFCAFIDFKQAFDMVWRNGLWSKLINSNINGKCFKLIRNMYNNI